MKQSNNNFKGVFILTKILLIIAWCLLIIAIMTKPFDLPDDLEPKFTLYDKIVHIIMFGGLTMLWLLLWQEFKWFVFKKGAFLSIGFAFFFAYSMEYLQQFIPGRMSNLLDLAFGALGMFISVLLYYLYFYNPKPKLLLHICCATCGTYVSQLLSNEFRVSLFYYNPNIYPKEEKEKRLAEVKKISKKFKYPLIIGKYDHRAWLKAVKGHEHDLEKGERCHICYEFRLNKTAKLAKENRFGYFATTLSVSPHKLAKVINKKGEDLANEFDLKFLARDFKKQDGFKKAMEISKKFGFYRQDYCGCEFS
ncbi:MAG: epoxyqueuosine reductase QueH, partial [bacterium]